MDFTSSFLDDLIDWFDVISGCGYVVLGSCRDLRHRLFLLSQS